MANSVMEWDFPCRLEKPLNLVSTDILMHTVRNASFSYPLSIFSLKIPWFYWPQRIFTLKTTKASFPNILAAPINRGLAQQ